MTRIEFFIEIFPIDQLNPIATLTNEDLQINIFPATKIWEMINIFGALILTTCYELASRSDLWYSRSQ